MSAADVQLAWDTPLVSRLQDEHRVTITLKPRTDVVEPLLMWLFGAPAAVALAFSRITPFWYLQGDDG